MSTGARTAFKNPSVISSEADGWNVWDAATTTVIGASDITKAANVTATLKPAKTQNRSRVNSQERANEARTVRFSTSIRVIAMDHLVAVQNTNGMRAIAINNKASMIKMDVPVALVKGIRTASTIVVTRTGTP